MKGALTILSLAISLNVFGQSNIIKLKDLLHSTSQDALMRLRYDTSREIFTIEKCTLSDNKCKPVSSYHLPEHAFEDFAMNLEHELEKAYSGREQLFDSQVKGIISFYGAAYLSYSKIRPRARYSLKGGFWIGMFFQELIVLTGAIKDYLDYHELNGAKKSIEQIIKNSTSDMDADQVMEHSKLIWKLYEHSIIKAWEKTVDHYWS